MLQRPTEEVAACLRQAAEAEARAKLTNDTKSKADYQLIADSWRKLAQHNQFQEPLERFISLDESRSKALPSVSSAESAETVLRNTHQRGQTDRSARMARPKARMGGESMTAPRAERLASLVTLSYEPMLAWHLDGPIEFWNAGAERLYGFASEEAIGRSSHSLLQTKFPIEFAEVISRLRNDGNWSGELRHLCKDGREVIVDSRQQLLADGTVLEVNRDVTALRENEEQLRWLASIVGSSDDAIVSKNLDGIITSWNRGAERVFGYSAEEAIGQPITLVLPKDRQEEERTILTRIRRGEHIDHFETVRQRKDGGLIAVSLTISPVKSANGEIVGASKIARDFSAQKRSQEQIATLAREVEHRSKNLLANVLATVNLSKSNTAEGLKQAIQGRIQALANVHSLFVQTRWTGAELSTIARQELAPYEKGEARARVHGPQVLLEPDAAQSVGVILHELATNAAKYGALSVTKGQIDLSWSHESDGWLELRWIESGGPPVEVPTRDGFGGRVIRQLVGQRNGAVHFDWRAEGVDCKITLQT
jgi:PAS domain S-box-containing protein